MNMAFAQGIPLHYCIATAQGRRAYMEDTYCVAEVHEKRMLFAIFDGHGGQCVAKYCAQNIADMCENNLAPSLALTPQNVDQLFLNLDSDVCLECPKNCGATALVLFADKHNLHFANCGDSLAIVIDHNNHIHRVSQEHKVENEKERIRAQGGLITYDDGVARIYRQLNLSRALGDASLKEYVISDPYQYIYPLKEAKLIIMASDGLWDVYTPTELLEDISAYEKEYGSDSKSQAAMPSWLVTKAIQEHGSTDNVTLITIRPEYPSTRVLP